MGAMDEQVPGQTGGVSLQQFAQLLKNMSAMAPPMAPGQPGPGTQPNIAPRVGGAPPGIHSPASAPNTVTGQPAQPAAPLNLSGIGGAPQGTGPSAYPPMGTPQAWQAQEYNTKGARNAALIQGAAEKIQYATQQFKQKKFDQDVAQSRQIFSDYIAFTMSQDPALQKKAEAMLQDPKIVKHLEKAQKDPMSGAGVGLRLAYQDAQERNMQQAKLGEQQAKAAQEQAMAQFRQAMADKVKQLTPQTEQERSVALGTAPKADTVEKGNTAKEVAHIKADSAPAKLTVRGADPAVTLKGQTYTMDDVKHDPDNVPPAARKMIEAEVKSTLARQDDAWKKIYYKENQIKDRFAQTLGKADRATALKVWSGSFDADQRLAEMKGAKEAAKSGDQQAQFKVIASHIGLTKGKIGRVTRADYEEAAASLPVLQRIEKSMIFDDNGDFTGVRSGLTLDPTQIDQMVKTGEDAFKHAANEGQAQANFAGLPKAPKFQNDWTPPTSEGPSVQPSSAAPSSTTSTTKPATTAASQPAASQSGRMEVDLGDGMKVTF